MRRIKRFIDSVRQAWRDTERREKQAAMVQQEAKDESRWLRARIEDRHNAGASSGLLGEYLEFEHEMVEAHLPKPAEKTMIFMCGPPPMINFACKPNLEKAGHVAANVHCF